ncbi:MAG: hypothetical protein ACOYXC_16135 [Candidatus Rifleibacteriota bacterium]
MFRQAKVQYKRFLVLFFVLVVSSLLPAFANENAEIKTASGTVKIIFSRSADGVVAATLIPFDEDGSYPRSGWTHCKNVSKEISDTLTQRFSEAERFEDYFNAVWNNLGEDESSPILAYHGELLKIEPWQPAFLAEPKQK